MLHQVICVLQAVILQITTHCYVNGMCHCNCLMLFSAYIVSFLLLNFVTILIYLCTMFLVN